MFISKVQVQILRSLCHHCDRKCLFYILKRIAYHYAIGLVFINFSTNLLFFSSLQPKHLLNNYFKRPFHFRFPANSKKFLCGTGTVDLGIALFYSKAFV